MLRAPGRLGQRPCVRFVALGLLANNRRCFNASGPAQRECQVSQVLLTEFSPVTLVQALAAIITNSLGEVREARHWRPLRYWLFRSTEASPR